MPKGMVKLNGCWVPDTWVCDYCNEAKPRLEVIWFAPSRTAPFRLVCKECREKASSAEVTPVDNTIEEKGNEIKE